MGTVAFILTGIVPVVGHQALFAQNFQWVRNADSPQNFLSQGNAVAVDSLGNIYLAGIFAGINGDLALGPGNQLNSTTNSGDDDIFLIKTDEYGHMIWLKTLNATSDQTALSIDVDAGGNVAVAGWYAGTLDFDPGPGVQSRTAQSTKDGYMLRLDTNGDFVSVVTFGAGGTDQALDVAWDGTGNVYLLGSFTGTVDFDPGPSTSNLTSASSVEDAFVVKYGNAGNVIWAKRIGGSGSDRMMSIDLDPSGNLVMVGEFQVLVDFDPNAGTFTVSTTGVLDIFLTKWTPAGNLMFVRTMGSPGGQCHPADIKVSPSGKLYSVGVFPGTMDLNPGPAVMNLTSEGGDDIYLQCLDASGNFIWAKQLGDSLSERVTALGLDAAEGVHATGYFQGYVDFDPDPNTTFFLGASSTDVYQYHLDSTGAFQWAGKWGACCTDVANALYCYPDGSTLSTGRAYNAMDFDPNSGFFLAGGGGDAIFLHKLGPCVASRSTLSQFGCDSVTVNGESYDSTGTYEQVLTNHVGCDSFLTLPIYLYPTTTSALAVDTCAPFVMNGQIFTSSGTFQQSILNHYGCDSIITLTLTLRQPSLTHIVDSACSTYTLNGVTYTASGIYDQLFQNAVGCDSVVRLDLTIQRDSIVTYAASCDSFVFGGQVYHASGVYTFSHTNQAGCDSVEVLHLQVDTMDTTVAVNGNTLTAQQGNAVYQWVDCNAAYAPILGEIGQSFAPQATGSYAVVVAYGECAWRSPCFGLTVVGTVEPGAATPSIGPNPTDGRVTIDLGDWVPYLSVKVWNSLGQQVQSGWVENQSAVEWELPGVSGIYWIELVSESSSHVFKVVRY